MALTSFGGGKLWGCRHGSGRPRVLALHGWGRDHHDFDQVLSGLDAVALDLPGHGVAPEPPGPWSTRQYAEWVAPVLADMGPGPSVLVGHSFGGRVALQLAAFDQGESDTNSTGNVGALVLSGVPLGPLASQAASKPAFAYRLGRALNRVKVLPDAQMERLRRKYGSSDYGRATPVMRGVLVKSVAETASGAYWPLLHAWAAGGRPLELVWGQLDSVTPLSALELGTTGLPSSVHISVVPGAGHLIAGPLAGKLREVVMRCLHELEDQ
ncbi:MAG: alpha/beta fold hydrolase [Acidimicrobiales bacterium]